MKLGLGTVQFGLDYGISNKSGRPSRAEAAEILACAKAGGITCLDTASLYGDSEEVLGDLLPAQEKFRIVTKTPHFKTASIGEGELKILRETFARSLARLKRPGVYSLMVHHCDDIFSPGGAALLARMAEWKKEGLIEKVGVSVYGADQIDRLLAGHQIDLVQLPMNLLDQRLIEGGQLSRLKAAGVEVHVRSAFLQGLLLMGSAGLPPEFASVREHLALAEKEAAGLGIPMLGLCLGFLVSLPEVDQVLVGVNSSRELREILGTLPRIDSLRNNILRIAPSLAWRDVNVLNPALWRKNA